MGVRAVLDLVVRGKYCSLWLYCVTLSTATT
jgi:hypothetical protein